MAIDLNSTNDYIQCRREWHLSGFSRSDYNNNCHKIINEQVYNRSSDCINSKENRFWERSILLFYPSYIILPLNLIWQVNSSLHSHRTSVEVYRIDQPRDLGFHLQNFYVVKQYSWLNEDKFHVKPCWYEWCYKSTDVNQDWAIYCGGCSMLLPVQCCCRFL